MADSSYLLFRKQVESMQCFFSSSALEYQDYKNYLGKSTHEKMRHACADTYLASHSPNFFGVCKKPIGFSSN